MKVTVAALLVLSAAASAEAGIRKVHGNFYNCGVVGSACGKRDLMNLVEARNAAELERAEDYFRGIEARSADPVRKSTGKFYNCGVIGSACGKRDLEYLGILERDADANPVRKSTGKFYNCGVIGSACGKRDVMEKIEARNAKRTANAEAILARNPDADAAADPIRKSSGSFYNCGVIGSACGKRDLGELDVLAPEHEDDDE